MAAAGLFAAACQRDAAKPQPSTATGSGSAKVVMFECHGINECRGKSACMTPANECAGQNACKGRGWLMLSEADCKTKGGAPKPMAGM